MENNSRGADENQASELRVRRFEKELTLPQLAEITGLSASLISEIERGRIPSPFAAARILKALGIKPRRCAFEQYFPGILTRHAGTPHEARP